MLSVVGTTWAIVASYKARMIFKEFDELLDSDMAESFLHSPAIDLPEASLDSDPLIRNSSCHGTLWNAVLAHECTPRHQTARQHRERDHSSSEANC
ncbi:MAG: hypothetical protein IMW89_22610 [Ktedonobacteraceae bacterium]|nr:hypothetical protein [Ktedonobacteraceae bacterium]